MTGTLYRWIGLFLPVLIPSWRFFAAVGPAPRIDIAIITDDGQAIADDAWRELLPRPDHLSAAQQLAQLLWSPAINERLFWLSLAERLIRHQARGEDEHAIRLAMMLTGRLRSWLAATNAQSQRFAYRLILIDNADGSLVSIEAYRSDVHSLSAQGQ